MEIIRIGLSQRLNVSIFANSDYNWYQMNEIRLGLKSNLDIFQCVNPEFSYFQMEQIRLELLKYSTF